jgi:hypothetical protein
MTKENIDICKHVLGSAPVLEIWSQRGAQVICGGWAQESSSSFFAMAKIHIVPESEVKEARGRKHIHPISCNLNQSTYRNRVLYTFPVVLPVVCGVSPRNRGTKKKKLSPPTHELSSPVSSPSSLANQWRWEMEHGCDFLCDQTRSHMTLPTREDRDGETKAPLDKMGIFRDTATTGQTLRWHTTMLHGPRQVARAFAGSGGKPIPLGKASVNFLY